MPDIQWDRGLWWSLVLGLALRLSWVMLVPVEPVSDSAAYATFARNLLEHGVYGWQPDQPSAYWAVGTAAATAATFLVFGLDNFTGVVLLNLLAGGLTIVLVYRLAEIWHDRRTAQVAAMLVALWPNLIVFSSVLSSELWFIALTLAGLWFHERPSGRAWVNLLLCGLMWGLACYVRPVILLLPFALALVALPAGPVALVRATLRAAVLVLLIVLAVSPWTWRNAQVFGEPVLVSTNFGPNFWMGNNPDSQGRYMPLPDWAAGMGEVARAEALKAAAKDHIRSDPAGFILRTAKKVLLLHRTETIGVVWNQDFLDRTLGTAAVSGLKLAATGYWYLLLGGALLAVALRFRQSALRAPFHPAIAGWAYFTLLHAITVVEDRYHMPSSPFIAVLAALAVTQLWPDRGRALQSPGRRAAT